MTAMQNERRARGNRAAPRLKVQKAPDAIVVSVKERAGSQIGAWEEYS